MQCKNKPTPIKLLNDSLELLTILYTINIFFKNEKQLKMLLIVKYSLFL